MRARERAGRATSYAVLVLGSAAMLLPFYWMFVSAFKTPGEVNTTPPTWFPSALHLDAFRYAFDAVPLERYFVNSVVVMVVNVSVSMVVTILAAFAFSRLRFRFREVLFGLCVAMIMVPFELIVITNYSTIVDLGWSDTLTALIVPFTSNVLSIYLLRNFFIAVPDALYYSARVDGASNWQYLWRVMVPLARPALVTIALLNAIESWNAFLWPLLVINTPKHRTLPIGLYSFITDGGVRYERLMAAATIVVLPVLVLFLVARRHIVSGVARGGLKG